MYHLNMIASFPLVSGLVFAIINVVVGEIDLLADPGVINLDHGSLTLDSVINDIDLLKETNYDTLQDDDLISTIELVDDEVDGDVTVGGEGFDSDGDIIGSPSLVLPGDDISATITDDIDGEGPAAAAAAGAEEEAEVTTTTAKNVQTTRTTDPRLERVEREKAVEVIQFYQKVWLTANPRSQNQVEAVNAGICKNKYRYIGIAYCKSKRSHCGGSCQYWHLQEQI